MTDTVTPDVVHQTTTLSSPKKKTVWIPEDYQKEGFEVILLIRRK